MSDLISPQEFQEAEGTQDWRVIGDGMCAHLSTGSLADGARLVQAIAELPGVEPRRPDIDLRHEGVTVRLLTVSDDWFGPSQRDVEMARRISRLAEEHGLPADPLAVQSVLVVPGAALTAEVMPFWQAVLGYVRRPDREGEARVKAALAAGGRIVRDEHVPAWWTHADAAGNECDVATIRGRG